MSGCELVTLRGGLTVPLAVLRALWDFEDRGLHFRLDGDDIIVGPRDRLTDNDRAQLRRWKAHVIALLTYVPPVVQ